MNMLHVRLLLHAWIEQKGLSTCLEVTVLIIHSSLPTPTFSHVQVHLKTSVK